MVPVVYISVEEVSSIFNIDIDMARQSAIESGGFAYAKLNREVLKVYPEAGKLFSEMSDGYIIASTTLIKEWNLSDHEVEAILLHEEGHHVYGHVDVTKSSSGIQYDAENEVDADNYCIEKGYGTYLLSGLEKIIKGLKKELDGDSFAEFYKTMNPRLTNIRNQI